MASTTAPSHKRTASSDPEASKQPSTKLSEVIDDKETEETSPEALPTDASTPSTLKLTYHKGDIFAAPEHSLLIHACNTQGSWGAGIAAAFRTRYPGAYKIYRDYCLVTHKPTTRPIQTGTCLLIPPSETNSKAPKHWIGCLFTSAKYGKARDKPDVILKNTGPAMKELFEKVKEAQEIDGDGVTEVRMCKINSARFGVPWEGTVEVLEGIQVEEGWVGDVEVWSID